MSAAETIYTFRVPYMDVLERGRQQVAEMRAYRDGAVATPTSGTFTLMKPDGTRIVDAEAITSPISTHARFTLTTAHLPSTLLPLGGGYLEEWALVMPDGTTRTIRREAAVARRPLYPSVADADLVARYPDLLTQLGATASNFQTYIDAAWARMTREMVRRGIFDFLVVDTSALHDWLEHEILADVFWSFFRGQGADRWKALAERHERLAATHADRAALSIDADHDGRADNSAREVHTTTVHPSAAPDRAVRSPHW